MLMIIKINLFIRRITFIEHPVVRLARKTFTQSDQ